MTYIPKKPKIVWPGGMYYFMTNAAFLHRPYFRQDEQKQLVKNFLKELQERWRVSIQAYAIPMNHNHLMFYAGEEGRVTFVKKFLKGNITREYRRMWGEPGQEIWQSTKVYWMRDDDSYWRVIGYIVGNLIKHKEVSTFRELYEYPYSSFKYVVDTYGWGEAIRMVKEVIDAPEDAYGVVDFKKLKSLRPRSQ